VAGKVRTVSNNRLLPGTLEMVWNGRRYRRHPNSPHRQHRLYWMAATAPRAYLHRDIYESVHGPVPSGWHVHHINGQTLDNRVENLAAIEGRLHSSLHYQEREWRIHYCHECGEEFQSRKPTRNIRWCSAVCKMRHRRRKRAA
jgi:HNH endonuclease